MADAQPATRWQRVLRAMFLAAAPLAAMLVAAAAVAVHLAHTAARHGDVDVASGTARLAARGTGSRRVPLFARDQDVYNTLFDLHGLDSHATLHSLRWGSYRPHLYFGFAALPLAFHDNDNDDHDDSINDHDHSRDTAIAVEPAIVSLGQMTIFRTSVGWIDESIRYNCGQREGVVYRWRKHDGRTFGSHEILDNEYNMRLTSDFVKVPTEVTLKDAFPTGGHWAISVSGSTLHNSVLDVVGALPWIRNIMPYVLPNDVPQVVLEVSVFHGIRIEDGVFTNMTWLADDVLELTGVSKALGTFAIRFTGSSRNELGLSDTPILRFTGIKAPAIFTERFNDIMIYNMRRFGMLMNNVLIDGSNAVVLQFLSKPNFNMMVSFISEDACKLTPEHIKTSVNLPNGTTVSCNGVGSESDFHTTKDQLEKRFQTRFTSRFNGIDPKYRDSVAVPVLSDLLGAISYNYGTQLVTNSSADKPSQVGPYSLLASSPSRPVFPRGFMWDEGFHNLLIEKWDLPLSLEILKSWISQRDEDGWIAREQILGAEASQFVPEAFRTQSTNIANPPMLYATAFQHASILKHYLRTGKKPKTAMHEELLRSKDNLLSVLNHMAKGIYEHYDWFKRTQMNHDFLSNYVDAVEAHGVDTVIDASSKADSVKVFRWNGQTRTHCLPSGLDDYPRRRNPDDKDGHVDLLAWMIFMSKGLIDICELLHEGLDSCPSDVYSQLKDDLKDYLFSIEAVHLDPDTLLFYDVHLERSAVNTNSPAIVFDKFRGYVQMLPMLQGVLDPNREDVGPLIVSGKVFNAHMDLLEELDSGFGLMSLSRRDPLFGTKENYWRGPIWMNFNIMALMELMKDNGTIYTSGSDNRWSGKRVERFVASLRKNLRDTVTRNYLESGFLYEQYNADTGEGQRTRPFNGWTSLIVLLLADQI